MAKLRPFKALRPVQKLAEKVAALPYDVMNTEEARKLAEGNPYSFLHVDKAEIDFGEDFDPYNKAVYAKAAANLDSMIQEGILLKDDQANLYIYRQVMQGRTQTGIVGCVSIDDYLNNVIKKHEYTRPDKEQDRINHVDYCDAHTGPIFMAYRGSGEVDRILAEWTLTAPLYDFTSADGVAHTVWRLSDEETINSLCQLFDSIPSLYIADGHHRAISAVKVGEMRRQQNPNYKGDEEFNFFLAVLFSHQDLYIMDYNRVVADLNGLTPSQFLDKVSQSFELSRCAEGTRYKPCCKHAFGLYLEGKWYKLWAKEGTFDPQDPVQSLDVSILQNNLLCPILGIKDQRTDKRIDFVGGIRGLEELERRVAGDMELAFSLYPTSIEDLMRVSDSGEVMPPKSTWFEPKLRSGLFVHKLK